MALGQVDVDYPYDSRVNTFGVFAGYSNDSSHILLGNAENRRLLDIGLTYNRRLLHGWFVNWEYSGELLPVAPGVCPMPASVSLGLFKEVRLLTCENAR